MTEGILFAAGSKVLALRPGTSQFWGPAKIVNVKDDGYIIFFQGEPKTHYTVELTQVRERATAPTKAPVPVIDLTLDSPPPAHKQYIDRDDALADATEALDLDPYSPPISPNWDPSVDVSTPPRSRPSFGSSTLGDGARHTSSHYNSSRNERDSHRYRQSVPSHDSGFYFDRNRTRDRRERSGSPPRYSAHHGRSGSPPRYSAHRERSNSPQRYSVHRERSTSPSKYAARRERSTSPPRYTAHRERFASPQRYARNNYRRENERTTVSPNRRAREIEDRMDEAMNNRHPTGWLTHMSLGIGRDNGRSGWRTELERRRISREHRERERKMARQKKNSANTRERKVVTIPLSSDSSDIGSDNESNNTSEEDDEDDDDDDEEVVQVVEEAVVEEEVVEMAPAMQANIANLGKQVKQTLRKRPPSNVRHVRPAKRLQAPSRTPSTIIDVDMTSSDDVLDQTVLQDNGAVRNPAEERACTTAPAISSAPEAASQMQGLGNVTINKRKSRARKKVQVQRAPVSSSSRALRYNDAFIEACRPRRTPGKFSLEDARKRFHAQFRAARKASKLLTSAASSLTQHEGGDDERRYNLRPRGKKLSSLSPEKEVESDSDNEDVWALINEMRIAAEHTLLDDRQRENVISIPSGPPVWFVRARRGNGRRKNKPRRNAGLQTVAILHAADEDRRVLRRAHQKRLDVAARGHVILSTAASKPLHFTCICSADTNVPRAGLLVSCVACNSFFHLWCGGFSSRHIASMLVTSSDDTLPRIGRRGGRPQGHLCMRCADAFTNGARFPRSLRAIIPTIATALIDVGRVCAGRRAHADMVREGKARIVGKPASSLSEDDMERMSKNVELLRMGVLPPHTFNGPLVKLLQFR